MLVRGGTDIEARHRVDGTTPFIYFLRKGDEYGARLLIDGGADTNATCRYRPDYDMGPIAFAYSQNMWSLLRPLVERSTDAFAGVLEACHLAASTGDKDTIMTLLSMPQITADEELHTTTATFSKYGWGENVDRVWLEGLLARGANINHSIEGKTSLMCAARHSAVQLVPLLIELGADVNAKGRHGWTALHIAATNTRNWWSGGSGPGPLEVIRCLLDHGADILALMENGSTPLDIFTNGYAKKMVDFRPRCDIDQLLWSGSKSG